MDPTPWYQEVWFVIVVIGVILLVLFVIFIVVCIHCVGPEETYIRHRMPLPPPRQKLPRNILVVGDAYASGVNAGPGVGVVNPVFSTPTATPIPQRRPPPSPIISVTADPKDHSERCQAEETETGRAMEMEMEMKMVSRETGDGASGDEEGKASAEKGKHLLPVPARRGFAQRQGTGVDNPVFPTPTPTPAPRRLSAPFPTADPRDHSEHSHTEETETETETEMVIASLEIEDGASDDEDDQASAENGGHFLPVPAMRGKKTTLEEMAKGYNLSSSGFVTTQQTIIPATAV